MMGNVNEFTPDGRKTIKQTGTFNYTDPYTHQQYNIPQFTSWQQLSGINRKIKNQSDHAKLGLSSLANQQAGFLQDYMGKPFEFDDQKHTQWATDLYNKINGPGMQREQDANRSRLSNMGLSLGSEAYNNEMNRVGDNQNHARDQFMLDSYGQDFATQKALRDQPLNEINALMSGSQISPFSWANPSMPRIPTTDNAGIIGNYDQQRMQAAQANGASLGGLFSGIGSLFSLSDKRVKKDVKKVGTAKNGLGIYSYRYIDEGSDAPIRIGLMAQEVEKKKPEAVATGADGLKRVNYEGALDLMKAA